MSQAQESGLMWVMESGCKRGWQWDHGDAEGGLDPKVGLVTWMRRQNCLACECEGVSQIPNTRLKSQER